ncbi:hypothetical protein N7468_008828 [Penicillium chermesinum]|uniref:Xylanolytic transcriptional activator regulatory domain-containing protein n=1 Tax=Penicillium chermesinum TaxID=63820 RepID=A0A9W9NJ87_9EURO|nr:uncharacterized protein N7468_008828 [Penicillium chermesinum]KAJ5219624.1 hypothetical protein N7468_008828 [Penicillium chermesinum]
MVGVGMFMDILDTVEPLLQDANSRALFDLQKCKLLGKFIKTRRSPAWPTIPTHNLPPKDLADTLVGIYLRTFEACTRVFHIPTFKRDYEALWAARAPPDMAFVIQLKLVLAIAAPMYDDEFSLRASAIHWIYEAQTYISEPDFKARLSLPHLQTIILHFMAREVVGVEGGLIWISVGGLIRTAVYMGLHRDPVNLPMRSNFVCEMRRRLWNTILELALTTCMAAGAPPLLSLDDFDTSPPGNLDDEDLASPDPIAKPLNQPSQMSIALALRSMFPVRLAISEMLNGIGRHATYEETIRLETELRRQYKGISKTMQAFDGDSASLPNKFQTQALDFQFRRSLLALHTAFFVPALTQERYAFSRRVVVDTATQIWAAARPRSGLVLSHLRDSVSDDYVRLAKNGHGTLRQIALSAVLLLAGELKAQIKEDDSLGPVVLRRDFLDILDDAIEWQWETIEAGEVNTKGFLFLKLVKAQISGFMEGLSRDQFAPRYVRAAEEAEERCLAFLESQVGLEQEDLRADLQGINEMSVNSFPDFMDFDFSMNYPMAFDLDMTDPKAWLGGID